MSDFPHLSNSGKARVKDNELTFTYIDSYGDVIKETKNILSPKEIIEKVKDRMERFHDAGPGSRESELSRAERKWIAAHPLSILKKTWKLLDENNKMEFIMMFSHDSHHGISDPGWAKEYSKDRHEIIGDNMVPL